MRADSIDRSIEEVYSNIILMSWSDEWLVKDDNEARGREVR